jgi:DNA polymerase-3 subunit beta
MKLQINKGDFLRSWQIAERNTSPKSTINSLSGVLVRASAADENITLEATDLKTSVKCIPSGVTVEREGEAVLPVRLVGELFKMAPTGVFTVSVEDGKGVMSSGRNQYKFTTYPTREFLVLPASNTATFFCSCAAADLLTAVSEGTVASTVGEDFPKYLGTTFFRLVNGVLKVVSTDGRRLSLSEFHPSQAGDDSDFLLPLAGVRELQRLLTGVDSGQQVVVLAERTLAFFQAGSVELSIRRVDAAFPDYESILSDRVTNTMEIDKASLVGALERIDVIVRNSIRTAILTLSPGGDLTIRGTAQEIGTAREILDATIDGESMTAAFNTGYLIDGLKAIEGDRVLMNFDGPSGQMSMYRPGDRDFFYMLMPVKVSDRDLQEEEED